MNSSEPGRKPYGTRLYQIVKCLDNMEEYQGWHKKDPSIPLVFMVGQMDQWEELHRLLYEEQGMVNIFEYQTEVSNHATYPGANTESIEAIQYCTLGLAGEAGEVANKVKKLLRDGDSDEKREAIIAELGDVLWYLSQLASEFNVALNDVLIDNLEKIRGRRERGTIGGEGDKR